MFVNAHLLVFGMCNQPSLLVIGNLAAFSFNHTPYLTLLKSVVSWAKVLQNLFVLVKNLECIVHGQSALMN